MKDYDGNKLVVIVDGDMDGDTVAYGTKKGFSDAVVDTVHGDRMRVSVLAMRGKPAGNARGYIMRGEGCEFYFEDFAELAAFVEERAEYDDKVSIVVERVVRGD